MLRLVDTGRPKWLGDVPHHAKDASNCLPLVLRLGEPSQVIGGTDEPIRCFFAARQFILASESLVFLQPMIADDSRLTDQGGGALALAPEGPFREMHFP